MIKGAKYAIRPLFDEESGASAGWQIIEMLAESNDSGYGLKVGEVEGNLLNVSALAFVQLVIASWQDAEKSKNADMVEESGHGGGHSHASAESSTWGT